MRDDEQMLGEHANAFTEREKGEQMARLSLAFLQARVHDLRMIFLVLDMFVI